MNCHRQTSQHFTVTLLRITNGNGDVKSQQKIADLTLSDGGKWWQIEHSTQSALSSQLLMSIRQGGVRRHRWEDLVQTHHHKLLLALLSTSSTSSSATFTSQLVCEAQTGNGLRAVFNMCGMLIAYDVPPAKRGQKAKSERSHHQSDLMNNRIISDYYQRHHHPLHSIHKL